MTRLKVGDYVAGVLRPIKIRPGNTKYLGPTDEELELTAYQIAKDNLELRAARRYFEDMGLGPESSSLEATETMQRIRPRWQVY